MTTTADKRLVMAEWHCRGCGKLLGKYGPSPGHIEVQCPKSSCKTLNILPGVDIKPRIY